MPTDGDIKNVALSHTQSFCYVLDIQLAQGHADSGTIVFRAPEESPLVREPSSLLQFHFCSKLLDAIPREAGLDFLRHMKFRRIKQGERIVRQGEQGSFFYLILQGTCVLNVEKNNMLYNAGQFGPGDAAGESVLFDDEAQKAHVDAETDMDVLSMSREEYETLSAENPELRNF